MTHPRNRKPTSEEWIGQARLKIQSAVALLDRAQTNLGKPGGSSLKMLREDLCRYEADEGLPHEVRTALHDVIHIVDWHRPLGPDGTHGDRHTDTCGCEDK